MNILVLCTGNSCRSQIAHGFLNYYTNESVKLYSAGIETHGVNPKAIFTLKQVGIDISNHTSNHIDEYKNINFDFVITVCDNAKEKCPVFPTTAMKFHCNFPDPAKVKGNEAEIMDAFHKVREMIRIYIVDFVKQSLPSTYHSNI